MFETAILDAGRAPRRVWTTCAGVTTQAMVVLSVALMPMIWPQVLPQAETWIHVYLPTAPPAPPPPLEPTRPIHAMPNRPIVWNDGRIIEPIRIPPTISVDEPPTDVGRYTGPAGGGGIPTGSGGPSGFLRSIFDAVRVPAPAPAPVRTQTEPARPAVPIRVKEGGLVHPAVLVHRIDPVYPALARAARVSGVVEIEGVIGIDGRIRELHVTSGHPLLTAAALNAVRQWIYQPTRLNGDPVEVITMITVTFRLGN
jgi:protein TonB